eukprot:gene7136-7497_t
MHALNGNIAKQMRQDIIVATLTEAGYQQCDRIYRALLQKLGDEEVSALATRPAGPMRTAAIVARATRLRLLDDAPGTSDDALPAWDTLRPSEWDTPVRDAKLDRGGTGVAYVTNTGEATALAQAVAGGGGRLAIVTAEPIRRPDPDGWDKPDDDTFPSECARVAFTAGPDSIRVLKRYITQLGADPVVYRMDTAEGPASEP